MSCFNKVSTATANSDLDLTKHVNYTSGMILGVDDFTQEFAYLAGRDRWLARDALGFGTVSGLKVEVDKDGEKGARVMVLPGVAISPRGQFICVSSAQCAYLNEWIAANDGEVEKHLTSAIGSPPVTSPQLNGELTLYVVLCYRDCPVDSVPIPGEPCRSEENLTAASRIQDDFSLELRFEAPGQSEEEKVREYVEWLKQIKIVETGGSTKIEEFVEAVRAVWLAPSSPPVVTSPPAGLQINAGDICDYMRTAFRLWVTELRNVLSGRKTGCSVEMTGGADLEDCILLAKLGVPLVAVSTGWKVSDSEDVALDEEKRPFLLHLRMLQEWMLCNFSQISGTTPTVTSPPPPDSLKDLSDVEFSDELEDGHVLIFDGTKWVNKKPETGGGGSVTDHGNLVGHGDDDHKQYLLVDGTRAMKESLDAGGFHVKNLKAAENNGEAVVFEQAVKQADAAQGDLSGTYPNPTVAKLQGHPISADTPQPENILIFKSGVWTPQELPVITQPVPQTAPFIILPLATITRVEETGPRDIITSFYEIWFNIDAPGNLAQVIDFQKKHLQILEETSNPDTFTNIVKNFTLEPERGIRNVFKCVIPINPRIPAPETVSGKLRFRFSIPEIGIEVTVPGGGTEKTTLAKYARKENIKFSGSLDAENVTIFVRGENPPAKETTDDVIIDKPPVIIDKPPIITDKPPIITDRPVIDKPPVITDKPVIDKTPIITDKPPVVIDKPITNKPPIIVDKPITDKPITNRPVINKPIINKPK